MKSKLKSILIILAIIVLCLSVGVYAGYTLTATEVTYTKPDGTTVSVKDALDELRAKESANDKEITVGDEVIVGGELFYVLGWDNNRGTVDLIAKYNLNTAGTAQQNDANSTTLCEFSSTNYWSSRFTSSPFNLNDINLFGSADAVGKAKSYGRSKGAVESRLLRLEEVNALKANVSSNAKIATMLCGKANVRGYLEYWLGDAADDRKVYGVTGKDDGYVSKYLYYVSDCFGVRPVITVLKSSVYNIVKFTGKFI